MEVIDHEPHDWFLFEHESTLIFDVNYAQGAVGLPMLFRLDEAETAAYRTGGRAYLLALATRVHNEGLSTFHQPNFFQRNLGKSWQDLSSAAVERWRNPTICP